MELCNCKACTEEIAEKEEKLYQKFKKRLLAELQEDFKHNSSIRQMVGRTSPRHCHDHPTRR